MSPESAIAVVGLGCTYPDARSPAQLWETVLAERRAFRRIPDIRLPLRDYASRDPAARDRTYIEEAALIEGYDFDRVHFRIAGSTFRSTDLTHWLALDMANAALADAGFDAGAGLPRETTGVIVGNTLTGEFSRASLMRLRWPYVRRVVEHSLHQAGWSEPDLTPFLGALEERYKAPFPPIGEETLAGGLANTIAGRICNHFDLQGGGFTVDGACASSLLAIIQACSALSAGDLDVALAGGVDLSLDPFELVGFAKTHALTQEVMRVYDARSAGFWPGEGCGFAVLMRAAEARARGLHIKALIRGWGVSSDGQGGMTRPEVAGQLLALRRGYRRAGFGIDTVGYFEGHGTGTAVGDTAELEALSRAIRETGHVHGRPAAIGSVKANIGHTKAAAGIAGLIKAVEALRRQVLPPTTGVTDPHPLLTGPTPALRVLSAAEPWPEDRPLRAAVSAMGFGGINTHIVLEAAPAVRRQRLTPQEVRLATSAQDCELLLLAAADRATLTLEVQKLRAVAVGLSRAELADAAFELQRRLGGGRARLAIVAATPAELVERLDQAAHWIADDVATRIDVEGGVFLGVGMGSPRIGLLFPGQGSPARRNGGAWQRRFAAVRELLTAHPLPDGTDLVSTDVAQPAIVRASLAGLRMLADLGIDADVALGHSLGELSALHWAGAWDEDQVLHLARVRGQAMADLGAPSGAMLSIGAGGADVEPLVAGLSLQIAAYNSPRQTVVSGETRAIDEALARIRAAGYPGVRLATSHAFHSPLVAAATSPLLDHLARHRPRPLLRPVASTITGRVLGEDEDLCALLGRQVTAPVRFTEALAAAQPVDLWIEVGPGSVLAGLVRESVSTPVVSMDAGGDSLRGLLRAVASAFAVGAPCMTGALFADRFTRPLSFERSPSFFANPCEIEAPVEAPAARAQLPVPPVSSPVASISPASPVVPVEVVPALAAVNVPARAEAASPAGGTEETPLRIVRALVAARAELPESAVGDEDRLLGDLHLNSISVGQIAIEAARRLGLSAPIAPLEYAQARVRTLAEALEALRDTASPLAASQPLLPAGIDAWVRPFAIDWVEVPAPRSERTKPGDSPGPWRPWRVFAPERHPLAEVLEFRLSEVGPGGVAVCLPPEPAREHALLLLRAAHAALAPSAPGHFLLVQHGGGGSAFARTLHQEAPHLAVVVVDVPAGSPRAIEWVLAEAAAALPGFIECRYDEAGTRLAPRMRLLPPGPAEALPLGPADVLLVTGGGKGIAAECALALARRTGAKLALLGRSHPEEDAELAGNLGRIRGSGVTVRYKAADVTDARAVKQAVERLVAELGPVTAVLHGAGTNVPRLLTQLDERALEATLGPKVLGAHNVLAAVPPHELRLFVAFSSIIGRLGMAGEADYALANEWLTRLTERVQRENPTCRCVSLEWSVWSGVGMGERLGRVEMLAQQGIGAIPPDQGIAWLLDLLAQPSLPTTLVVSGRVGKQLPLQTESPPLPFLRFLERVRVHYPGIELVVEAELSSETDLSLDDHVFHGERLLPAVLGMEAMAQAVVALTGVDEAPTFEDVTFTRPVVVPPGKRPLIRVAALVRSPGLVHVALRCDQTAFQVDHFRATCRVGVARLAGDTAPLQPLAMDPTASQPREPLADFYGRLFFHRGRFCRIGHYHRLRATECVAELTPAGAQPWFARFLPPTLVLGDPAARDAALHGIQACIPHERLIPSGVDAVRPGVPGTPRFIMAQERSRSERTFVYDMELRGDDGALVERWEGLKFQVMEAVAPPTAWPTSLLAPYVERRLSELLRDRGIHVATEQSARPNGKPDAKPDAKPDGRVRSDRALRCLLGTTGEVPRRPDGKPEAGFPDAGWMGVSVAHAGDLTFAVAGRGQLGCDLQTVESRPSTLWSELLGPERMALAELLAREHEEDLDAAATRVWTAMESIKKAGLPDKTPLVLDGQGGAPSEHWLLFSAGGRTLATWRANVHGTEAPLVFAVLSGAADAGV